MGTRAVLPRRALMLRPQLAGLSASSRAAPQTTLRLSPQQDPVTLDPGVTTATMSRNHGDMVFDTLYGIDASVET